MTILQANQLDLAPVEGLGSTVQKLDTLARGDIELEDLLDKALQRQVGRPETVNSVQCTELTEYPSGNTAAAAIRRLRKDRPDLHQRVLAGDLSLHAAAIEAGFRKHTIQVPTDPARAAAIIVNHFDRERAVDA